MDNAKANIRPDEFKAVIIYTRDELVENYEKFKEHNIDERFAAYTRLIELDKSKDWDNYLREVSLLGVSSIEHSLLNIFGQNLFTPKEMKRTLEYWVKVHNYLRVVWNRNNFVKTYTFKSLIKEEIEINQKYNSSLPYASNVSSETTAIISWMDSQKKKHCQCYNEKESKQRVQCS